jgi:hypothetical protein
MGLPILIAETPNAGTLGHRFLVSDGSPILGDLIISEFIQHACKQAQRVGGNYIGVRREVVQYTTGRPGAYETLVLVGVDSARIPAAEQQRIIDILRARLTELDAVVRAIDWRTEKRLVVPNRTLASWLADGLRDLPVVADIASGPQEFKPLGSETASPPPTVRPSSGRVARWLALAMLLLLVPAGVWFYLSRPPSSADDQLAQSPSKTQPEVPGVPDIRPTDSDKPTAKPPSENQPAKPKESGKSNEDHKKKSSKLNREYLEEIDQKLQQATDVETVKAIRQDLKRLPEPNHLTDDDRRFQAQLIKVAVNKLTELEWQAFKKGYDDLVSVNNFQEAAKHLKRWTAGGKEREHEKLKQRFKEDLYEVVNRVVKQGINKKLFDPTRRKLKSQFESREIEEIVGVRFFEQAHAQLDDAQDKYLYERIRSSSTSVQDVIERVKAYLKSPVKKKWMEHKVEELKEYLEAPKFEGRGTPTKPNLPAWKAERTDETATPRRGEE